LATALGFKEVGFAYNDDDAGAIGGQPAIPTLDCHALGELAWRSSCVPTDLIR
jgi:hypothetical protein